MSTAQRKLWTFCIAFYWWIISRGEGTNAPPILGKEGERLFGIELECSYSKDPGRWFAARVNDGSLHGNQREFVSAAMPAELLAGFLDNLKGLRPCRSGSTHITYGDANVQVGDLLFEGLTRKELIFLCLRASNRWAQLRGDNAVAREEKYSYAHMRAETNAMELRGFTVPMRCPYGKTAADNVRVAAIMAAHAKGGSSLRKALMNFPESRERLEEANK